MVRRRSRVREWWLVLIAVVTLVLVVLGVVALVEASRPTVDRAEDVAVFSPPLPHNASDVVTGELRREAGCTYLDGDDGRRWLVLFPDLGTRWQDDALLVGDKRYPEGSSLGLRGLIVKLPAEGYSTDIPPGCRDPGLYFLVLV